MLLLNVARIVCLISFSRSFIALNPDQREGRRVVKMAHLDVDLALHPPISYIVIAWKILFLKFTVFENSVCGRPH